MSHHLVANYLRTILKFLVIPAQIFCSSNQSFAGSNPIRIAVIAPLSGEASSYGYALRNGITLALEDLSKEQRGRLNVVFEDDQLVPKNSVTALRKVQNDGAVNLVISPTSGTSSAIAPLAEAGGFPHLALASDQRISRGRKYPLNFFISPEDESIALVKELQRRGLSNIAVFSTSQDGCLALKDALDMARVGSALTISLSEDYPIEEKDLKSFALKIRSNRAIKAVYSICISGHCGLFAKQLREAGVKLPLYGVHTFEDKNEVEASQGGLFGARYITTASPSQNFVKKYEEKFKDLAVLWLAAYGYDAIGLVGDALNKGVTDSKTLNDFLHNVKEYRGVLGHYASTGDNRFKVPATVKEITSGGFVPVTD